MYAETLSLFLSFFLSLCHSLFLPIPANFFLGLIIDLAPPFPTLQSFPLDTLFCSNFMGLVTYKRSIGSRCPSRNCFPAGPGLHCHGWPSVSSARHVSITASHLLYRSKTGLDTSLLPSFPVQGAPL